LQNFYNLHIKLGNYSKKGSQPADFVEGRGGGGVKANYGRANIVLITPVSL